MSDDASLPTDLERYARQMRYAPIGDDGQRRLSAARALVCGCGALGVAKKLEAKFSERVCNSVCMGAQGPSCSCSCDGENHGSAHVYRVSS